MSKPDGGPAFPHDLFIDQEVGEIREIFRPSPGLSIRDYFAGQALAVDSSYAPPVNHPIEAAPVVAEYAYLFADALLAARDKPG